MREWFQPRSQEGPWDTPNQVEVLVFMQERTQERAVVK